jgi:hypothetical protein
VLGFLVFGGLVWRGRMEEGTRRGYVSLRGGDGVLRGTPVGHTTSEETFMRVPLDRSTHRDDVRVFDHGVDEGDGEDHPELRRGLEAVTGSVSLQTKPEISRVLSDKPHDPLTRPCPPCKTGGRGRNPPAWSVWCS